MGNKDPQIRRARGHPRALRPKWIPFNLIVYMGARCKVLLDKKFSLVSNSTSLLYKERSRDPERSGLSKATL